MRDLARLLAVAACSVFPAAAVAQTAADPSGHWEGSIRWDASDKGPAGELSLEVDLARKCGGFAGAISIPAYSLKDRPLTGITLDGRSIRFQVVPSAPGDNAFDGSLSADGRSIAGTLSYRGSSLSFQLARTGDAKLEPPARSSAIGKELEGTWNGTLSVSGKERRLVLTLSNQADGTAIGSLLAVDQGNLEIPITTIVQEASNLTLDVKAVGGTYAGVVDAETGQLSGTWTQGTLALPLGFRRSTKQ